jgi:hypothetical protein
MEPLAARARRWTRALWFLAGGSRADAPTIARAR